MSKAVTIFHLSRQNMGAAVRHNVTLCGAPTGAPAVLVVAMVVRAVKRGWCVLADHPDNPGVSVTNGAAAYAQAVCRASGCEMADLDWFEIDSAGDADELRFHQGRADFVPLVEPGHLPRTVDTLLARIARLPAGLPDEARSLLEERAALFAATASRY